jgi:hypothetical protein
MLPAHARRLPVWAARVWRGSPARSLCCGKACAPHGASGCAHRLRRKPRDHVAPLGKPAPVPQPISPPTNLPNAGLPSCQSLAWAARSRMLAPPPMVLWRKGGKRGERSAYPRSGKGHARSRDCDVGAREPLERPARQAVVRLHDRSAWCSAAAKPEWPTLTASPLVPNLAPKHANAALLQLRKCEGKSGRSGRRDGGRGSIEISGHWPSCRPGLLWHWSSYCR